MEKLINRFLELNPWVKVVFCLCLLGGLDNAGLLSKDWARDGILFRLHLSFFLLYMGQVVFILCKERFVWVLAALQGVLALLTTADFTFIPLMRLLGKIVYACWPEPSLEYMKVYQYVLISLAFTLQMLSAYILFSLLPPPSYRAKRTDVNPQPSED